MELIRQFHQVELEHGLFELGAAEGLPIWDLARYHAYVKYCYPEEERRRLAVARPHPWRDYVGLVGHVVRTGWKLLTRRGANVIITVSRSRDAAGAQYDKSATGLIELLGRDCLVLEAIQGKRVRYDYAYDFACVFRRFFRGKALRPEYHRAIARALAAGFGENKLSEAELAEIHHNFQSDCAFYGRLFALKRTRKVFIAEGNPKAVLWAARANHATTYLLQHGGIEFDEVDYSYPPGITRTANLLFADHVLTLGDYWCQGLNVPARSILPVGNDYFYQQPAVASDGSVLVISTIVHGGELSRLTRELAALHPDLTFVYKLHPNEFHLVAEYEALFAGSANVTLVTDRPDVSVLVSRARLIIIIVSAVLYEALNQGRKVAIYRRLNFARQICVANRPNVFFFDQPAEVGGILAAPVQTTTASYFKPADRDLLRATVLA